MIINWIYEALIEKILERTKKNKRPKLPSNYNDLNELMQKCWKLNLLHWLKFENICKRLNHSKKKFIIGIDVANALYFGASKNNYH